VALPVRNLQGFGNLEGFVCPKKDFYDKLYYHNRGTTGSLSNASTPNTHSCTRRSGSFWVNRSNI